MGIHANLAHPLICNRFVYETRQYGTIGGGFEANMRSGCIILCFLLPAAAANGKRKSALLMNFVCAWTLTLFLIPMSQRKKDTLRNSWAGKTINIIVAWQVETFLKVCLVFMIHWSLNTSIVILLMSVVKNDHEAL